MINSSDEIYIIQYFEQHSPYIMHACKKINFPCCSVGQHGVLSNKILHALPNDILQTVFHIR